MTLIRENIKRILITVLALGTLASFALLNTSNTQAAVKEPYTSETVECKWEKTKYGMYLCTNNYTKRTGKNYWCSKEGGIAGMHACNSNALKNDPDKRCHSVASKAHAWVYQNSCTGDTHCSNRPVPPDTTSKDCNYISEVTKWSSCSAKGIRTALEYKWSKKKLKAGEKCEHVKLTKSCALGECGPANGKDYTSQPKTSDLCGDGDGLKPGSLKKNGTSNSWTWTCLGTGTWGSKTCSTNTCSANYGTTCESAANACGATNKGVYNCKGQCVNSLAGNAPVKTPDVKDTHPTYGETKTSPANACGAVNISRGSCTAPAKEPVAPSSASCPVGPVCVTDDDPATSIPASLSVPSDGIVKPTAIEEDGTVTKLGEPFRISGGGSTYKVGDKCLVYNPACSDQAPNESYVTCDGTCAVGQPVCGGIQCISRGNVEGKTNIIYVESAEQCNVLVPSDSVCEIPSFGFRTKNGLYTVDPGTEKTLVWDTVLNATSCTITGPNNETLAVINNFIRDTSKPQPGHSWTNILPSGEIETGEINQTSEYEMTCVNVDSPEVTERLRITLTPNVIEN